MTAPNILDSMTALESKAADALAARESSTEPEPLRAVLKPAEVYPVDQLGTVLGEAVKVIHESTKAPLALCCQSVLAGASLATQAHFDAELPWGECKPLSLFLLSVGESGERKSGVDDLVLGAAKVQERADMERYHEEVRDYQKTAQSWEAAADAARRNASRGGKARSIDVRMAVEAVGEKPEPPIVPLRFVSDPTVEGLFKLLAVGQPSVGMFSDEGGLLIGGHALNSENSLKTLARLCKFWDGAPFDRVRAGDGASCLYGRRLSLHQLAQPEVMVKLLSDPMANGQGFLARCLTAWPGSTIGTRQITGFEWAGDKREVKRLFAVFKTLMEAKPTTGKSEQELDPTKLPLTDGAKRLAVTALNQFEGLMATGGDLSGLRDRTSKALENACRIAGVLAVVEGGLRTQAITEDHLARGLVLVQWYLLEALRIRGAASVPQSVSDAEALLAWLRDRGLRAFRTAPVLTGGPAQLRNKSRLTKAIGELVENGYLVQNEAGLVIDGVRCRKSWRTHHVV
jgi:putative DNA primase/helicase